MNAQWLPRARVKMGIHDALRASLGGDRSLEVLAKASIELRLHDVPEPDLFIRTPSDAQRGAPDGSVKLVIKVADSSERHDPGRKGRIYAAHDIPEYWVAVLRTGTFERFGEPAGQAYTRHETFTFADGIASLTLPGVMAPAGTIA